MATNKLMTVKVKALSKTGRYGDGAGLWLQVSSWGTKSWIFRFMLDGRAREMGLGPVSMQKHDGGVTLAEAREKRDRLRKLVRDGIDPIEQRRADRDARRADEAARATFKEATQEYIALHKDAWTPKHKIDMEGRIRKFAYPTLGNRPVKAITSAVITEALAPAWTDKAVTARRVKNDIERICKWIADGKPLPVSRTRQVQHLEALPWQDMPTFMGKLRARDSVPARCLEFLVLTAARSSEARKATWDEIDLNEKLWIIPANRMKARKEHRVPLCNRALDILNALPREDGNPLVFLGATYKRPVADRTLRTLARDLTGDGVTVHGFRSSFKDWASEATAHSTAITEKALAHTIKDKVEAAYRRGDLLAKRRHLMADWSHFCGNAPAVTELRRSA